MLSIKYKLLSSDILPGPPILKNISNTLAEGKNSYSNIWLWRGKEF